MFCRICKKNKAKMVMLKIIGTNVEEVQICNTCANSILGKNINYFSFTQNNMDKILDNFLKSFQKHDKKVNNYKDTLSFVADCPYCGMNYQEFIKSGRLGCNQCYECFKKPLYSLLKKLHGHSRHKGKVPPAIRDAINRKKKIDNFKNELQRSILREDYERAAELRDIIAKEEKDLNNGTGS